VAAAHVTRVLIASDIRLYREGLLASLVRAGSFEVVGVASDQIECLSKVTADRPDVVLLDLAMADATQTVLEIVSSAPETRVVVLGVREVESEVIACAEAGVSGYVTREASLNELVEVVESVSHGEMLCSPRIAALLNRRVAAVAGARRGRPPANRLTSRETEVVDLIAEGLSNKQIARRLSIELATVKNHVHSILEKLEVERRTEVAARMRGMLSHAGAGHD
jgi:two-component system nitrate/nitrite response regulator NarL